MSFGYPKKLSPDTYKTVIDEAHKEHLRVAAYLYHLDDACSLATDGWMSLRSAFGTAGLTAGC
jgi:hypothetical protein